MHRLGSGNNDTHKEKMKQYAKGRAKKEETVTHVEGDDDAGGVIPGQLYGRAEESMFVEFGRDEART